MYNLREMVFLKITGVLEPTWCSVWIISLFCAGKGAEYGMYSIAVFTFAPPLLTHSFLFIHLSLYIIVFWSHRDVFLTGLYKTLHTSKSDSAQELKTLR